VVLSRVNKADFNRAVYHENTTTVEKEKLTEVAILPFQHTTSYRFSRLLGQFNIKAAHSPYKKTSRVVRHAKDNLRLKVTGVYSIPPHVSVEKYM
jgi:hypothetical protein